MRCQSADQLLSLDDDLVVAGDNAVVLEQLPAENAQYGGRIAPREMPDELRRSDVVLVTSKYEPFGLTVAEALASGVPVIATSEVGAIEGVDSAVANAVAPGDVPALASAIEATLQRLRSASVELRSLARAEAERRFARDVVCEQISDALERLVEASG